MRPGCRSGPGLAILVLVLGLNMVGDGLRDATDPKLAGRERRNDPSLDSS